MKTSLSLVCLIALASSFTAACGGDGGPDPLTGGTTGSGGGSGSGSTTGSGGAQTNVLFEGNGTWVAGEDNTVGIQGAFYILEDSVKLDELVEDGLTHTDFTPDTGGTGMGALDVSKFDETTVKPCISGTAVQVTDETGATGCNASAASEDVAGACQWSAQWGGGIGLNLKEAGGEGSVPEPYDALANGVQGFTFVASGDAGGAKLRVKATNAGSDQDFCDEFSIVPGQPVEVQWSELVHMCWGTAGTEFLDLTNLEALQWQVVTDQNDPHTVTNLCIESISWF